MTTTKKPSKSEATTKATEPYVVTTADRSRMAVTPSLNGAVVVQAYQGNIMGTDTDLNVLINQLRETFTEVKDGDMHKLEAMLISQATALQTIFTSLARRANLQEYQKNFESFLGLALKAQSQSRATITALVDLKYPKQATFVKQANIANGPQQVNNAGTQVGGTQSGTQPIARERTHAGKSKLEQNKLLKTDHGNFLDIGAQGAASRVNPHMVTVG